MRNRSVSSARRWIDAFRLSTSCELIDALREHQLHRRLRVARVAIDDGDERAIRRRRLEPELLDEAGEELAETGRARRRSVCRNSRAWRPVSLP